MTAHDQMLIRYCDENYLRNPVSVCVNCAEPKHEDKLVNGLCKECRCPECAALISSEGLCRDMAKCTDKFCNAIMIHRRNGQDPWIIVGYSEKPEGLNRAEELIHDQIHNSKQGA